MANTGEKSEPFIKYHKDGTVWAKGSVIDGVPTGYWEWFRKDGSKMRSGHFESGEQVGEWITYDQQGKVYKVTQMKATGKTGAPTVKKAATRKKATRARKT